MAQVRTWVVWTRNLCSTEARAIAELSGQNGRIHAIKPLVKALSCAKRKR